MVVGEKRGGAEEANTKKARVLRDQSLIWGGGGEDLGEGYIVLRE